MASTTMASAVRMCSCAQGISSANPPVGHVRLTGGQSEPRTAGWESKHLPADIKAHDDANKQTMSLSSLHRLLSSVATHWDPQDIRLCRVETSKTVTFQDLNSNIAKLADRQA